MSTRAIILEDDHSWQEILREILTDHGLAVDVVDNLKDACKVISQETHRIAIVDLSLDGSDPFNKDGLTFLKSLQNSDPGCTTLLLTGFATVEIAVEAMSDYGVFSCLRKEAFSRDEFSAIIRHVLSLPISHLNENKRIGERRQQDQVQAEDLEEPKALHALIVDDDAGWREILSELLFESGYAVRACTSFGEALSCLRRDDYNLLVIDLSLDGEFTTNQTSIEKFAGYKLLEQTESTRQQIIVVSGAASTGEIERTYQDFDVFAFIEKQTFDRNAFKQMLVEAAQKRKDTSILNTLTNREKEVLECLAKGFTNKEIASALVITPNTVKRHLKAIFGKMEIHTRSAAASMAAGWFASIHEDGP